MSISRRTIASSVSSLAFVALSYWIWKGLDWAPIWVRIVLTACVWVVLPLLYKPIRTAVWRGVKLVWPFVALFAGLPLIFWLFLLLPAPREVRNARTTVLDILDSIEDTPPATDSDGKLMWLKKGIKVAKQESPSKYVLFDLSGQDKPVGTILLRESTAKTLFVEIHYLDKGGFNFMTDYFDTSGHTAFAEYDQYRTLNSRPILYPYPFILPVPMLFPVPIFTY